VAACSRLGQRRNSSGRLPAFHRGSALSQNCAPAATRWPKNVEKHRNSTLDALFASGTLPPKMSASGNQFSLTRAASINRRRGKKQIPISQFSWLPQQRRLGRPSLRHHLVGPGDGPFRPRPVFPQGLRRRPIPVPPRCRRHPRLEEPSGQARPDDSVHWRAGRGVSQPPGPAGDHPGRTQEPPPGAGRAPPLRIFRPRRELARMHQDPPPADLPRRSRPPLRHHLPSARPRPTPQPPHPLGPAQGGNPRRHLRQPLGRPPVPRPVCPATHGGRFESGISAKQSSV